MGKTVWKWLPSLYIDIPALRPGTIGAYAFVVVTVAIATVLRLVLDPYLAGVQFITFFPAVVITTLISGFGAGFLCVVLGSAAADFFVLEPRLSFYVQDPGVVADLLAFDLLASYCVFLISWMRFAIEHKQLEANRDHLQLALDAAQLGWWEYDPLNRVAFWSDERSKEIYDVAEDKTDVEEFTKRVHPDDVEMVWAAIEAALDPADPKPYAIEFRLQRGDGEVRWVRAHGLTYFEGTSVERRAVGMVGTGQDITEHKQAEEEREQRERELLLMREASHRATLLEESRDRLQLALDSALLGWWQYDPIRRVVWGDTRLKEMFEIAEDWPNIEEFKRRVHPDDLERVWAAMEAAIDPINPKPYAIEYRHRRGDGEVRWIEAHARVHFEGSGRERRAVSMIGTGQDITERKEQEAAQARLAAIVTSSVDGIVGKTLDGIVTNWNEAAERMFGYSADEMIGQSIRRIIPADRQAEEDMILARLAQSQSIEHFETKRVTKDGRTFDASVTISPVRDVEGRVIGAAKIIRDITQRKRTQARLTDSEARFRAMFENAAVGIAHAAPDGRWLQVNQALCRIVGEPADELLTKTFEDITHPDDLAAEVAQIELAREGKIDSYVVDKRYPRKDGTIVWVKKTVGCVRKDDGSIDYFVSVMEDISAEKAYEEQIRFLMREANHRAKNILSIVQAIARQTAAREPKDFVGRFTARLRALGANQDLLIRNEWRGVEIVDLLRAQLAPFADLIGSRIVVVGPKLRLNAASAQAIGLALYELATNAGKYGALSTDTGRLHIGWWTEGETFMMSWAERDGPPVSPPQRRGFGTLVIQDMAEAGVDGEVELDYAPSGLVWRLTCPAANALEPREREQNISGRGNQIDSATARPSLLTTT